MSIPREVFEALGPGFAIITEPVFYDDDYIIALRHLDTRTVLEFRVSTIAERLGRHHHDLHATEVWPEWLVMVREAVEQLQSHRLGKLVPSLGAGVDVGIEKH